MKRFVFSADSLLKLLTHYSDGAVPLDAELRFAGVNRFLQRMVCLEASSKEWTDASPLHVRYEGKKTAAFTLPGLKEAGRELPEWKQNA